MSAGILKALMQLFAIIARGGAEGKTDSSREVVANFLQKLLNSALVHQYLLEYDAFVEKHHNKSKSEKKGRKRTSVNSVKILKICSKINEELAHKEKTFVLIRLLEFITAIEDANEQEWEFVETVADSFNIDRKVYINLKRLVGLKEDEIHDHSDFLYAQLEKPTLEKAHAIEVQGLTGRMVFYHNENSHMFFLRSFGNDELLLNGQNIMPNRCHVFSQGSSVRGPKVNPLYYSDVIHAFMDNLEEAQIDFQAEDLQYYFKRNDKQALHQLNIHEQGGNLIGIMGASGSGKSTLLNVLNGNYTPTFGRVTINGIDVHKQADQLEGVIGHVAQDDLLIEELTVFENLFYNAKLCFAKKAETEITEMVEATLNSLGLFEAKDLKVGSPLEKTISGGQRKRLNIALELIREPAVMFVDEPTSGLSSRDSENIMDLLKELTLKGKLIFVVIHQPSSDIFKMFDKLFLLDFGGYPIYYGNPVDSVLYFKKLVNHVNQEESECMRCGNVNPEQIFNIIESKVVDEYGQLTEYRKVTPVEWNNFYNVLLGNRIDSENSTQQVPTTAFSIPDKIAQFKTFMTRDVLSKVSNMQYMLINFLEAPLLAFVLSFFVKFFSEKDGETDYVFYFSENLPQFLFISVIVSLFLGLTVAAEEIIRDQKILKREKFLNLSRGSYLMSKIAIMFIISAIQSLSFVIVGNLILGIHGMMFWYWLILFSTSCFANLLGLNISASFNSAKVIYILIPILIIPQLLFSGVIVKFDKLYPMFSSQAGVPIIGNIMASRWAYEALTVNQFINNDYEKNYYSYDQRKAYFNWKKDFWVDELLSSTVAVKKQLQAKGSTTEVADHLEVLTNELSKEQINIPEYESEALANLSPSAVTLDDILTVEGELEALRQFYKESYKQAAKERRLYNNEITKTDEEVEQLQALKERYKNESLTDFVTNSKAIKNILQEDGELVYKTNPIYFTPVHKSFFQAHFYAPTKRLFGSQVPTPIANVGVIWLMTILLGIALHFDGLKKLLDWIGGISEKFKKKPVHKRV